MSAITRPMLDPALMPLPVNANGIPIFYEDEEEGDMGESDIHTISGATLRTGVAAHLAPKAKYRVFFNMNCYYLDGPRHPISKSLPYLSPDVMVVKPNRDLGPRVTSYTIGKDGPSPLFVTEVLSERSAQQRDMKEKIKIYARLRIREYALVDVTGEFLPGKLLLKRLQSDGTYRDRQDRDGGITSRLGFRIIVDVDGEVRVVDAKSGRRYPRPSEAAALAERIGELEQQLARFRELEDRIARLEGKKGLKRKKGD